MPQFLLIGVLISIAGIIIANWQKIFVAVILISVIGFGVLVLANDMSMSAAFGVIRDGLVETWHSIVAIGQSLFAETEQQVAS